MTELFRDYFGATDVRADAGMLARGGSHHLGTTALQPNCVGFFGRRFQVFAPSRTERAVLRGANWVTWNRELEWDESSALPREV